MTPHTSAAALSDYLTCPALYYFKHVLKLKGMISYPMLCGKAVHEFIAGMYRQRPKGRKFFYKSLESASGAWHYKWSTMLKENEESLMEPDKATAGKYRNIGLRCISNYWNANECKPDPVEIEQRRRIKVFGVDLVTVSDQVRAVSNEVVARYRPDLISDGQLNSGYSPQVIIDIKTSLSDWDRGKDTSELAKAGNQHHLASSIQATAYTRAYKYYNGVWPIGFFFYALYHNKFYFVSVEDEESQKRLDEVILHLVRNLNCESFPKHPTLNCRNCVCLQHCLGEKGIQISINTDSLSGPDIRHIFKREWKSNQPKQLRFKFPR